MHKPHSYASYDPARTTGILLVIVLTGIFWCAVGFGLGYLLHH